MNDFWSLLKFFSRNWKGFLFSAVLASLTIFSSVALLGTSSFLISMAALQPSIAELQVAIVGVRLFGISRGAFRYAERYISHTITFKMLSKLRIWFYQSIEPKAPAGLGAYHSGDLLNRIVADIETLQNFFIRVISPPLVLLVVFIGVSAWYIGFNPVFVPILAILFLVGGIVLPFLIQWLSLTSINRLSESNSELMVSVVDALQGSAEVRMFNLENSKQSDFHQREEIVSENQRKLGLIEAVQDGMFIIINGMGWLSILWIGIQAVESGAIEGVMLASLVMAGMASFEAVQPMPLAGQNLREGLQAWSRLSELLVSEPEEHSGKKEIVWSSGSTLQFNYVNLQYSDDEPARLRSITLCIRAGEKLAIIGPNGSGKTSLLNLLLKFWQPTEGEINIDGENLADVDDYAWRENITVIGQNTYLFNASLRENILIANPNASGQELESAIERSQLSQFVSSLPDGLETYVGELGRMISGGERQRVAIARALLKDAPVLLLDEPLVHLDAVTSNEIQTHLTEIFKGKTVIMVTHRIEEIEGFDHILMMDDGLIVADGTHHELLSNSIPYQAMVTTQAESFKLV